MRTLEHPARLDQSVDLRRKAIRARGEVLIERAEHLLADDRALIRTVYGQGLSVRAVAELRREPARAVRRRVRQLVSRMLSERFMLVVRRREQWPPTRRRVATACVLQGLPLRAASESLRLSLHTVRRHMEAVNALSESGRA